MLDSYIIERIRRERESSRGTSYLPLRIHVPDSPSNPGRRRPHGRQPEINGEISENTDRSYDQLPPETEKDQERGSIIIDFGI